MIFVDYSRNDGFSADGSQVGHVLDGLRLDVRGPLMPGLVRPVAVEMVHVLAEHQVQVALIEDQGPVQQFAAKGPDDALSDGIHPWRPRQSGNDPQPFGLEHLRERGGEERIAIMNQASRSSPAAADWSAHQYGPSGPIQSFPRGSKNNPLSTALAPRICATRIRTERSHSYTR